MPFSCTNTEGFLPPLWSHGHQWGSCGRLAGRHTCRTASCGFWYVGKALFVSLLARHVTIAAHLPTTASDIRSGQCCSANAFDQLCGGAGGFVAVPPPGVAHQCGPRGAGSCSGQRARYEGCGCVAGVVCLPSTNMNLCISQATSLVVRCRSSPPILTAHFLTLDKTWWIQRCGASVSSLMLGWADPHPSPCCITHIHTLFSHPYTQALPPHTVVFINAFVCCPGQVDKRAGAA